MEWNSTSTGTSSLALAVVVISKFAFGNLMFQPVQVGLEVQLVQEHLQKTFKNI